MNDNSRRDLPPEDQVMCLVRVILSAHGWARYTKQPEWNERTDERLRELWEAKLTGDHRPSCTQKDKRPGYNCACPYYPKGRMPNTTQSWVNSALKDYEKLGDLLRRHGVHEWDDTVTAVIALIESKK